MDSLFPADPELRGTISIIYTKLSSVQSESLDALRAAWQADLNVKFKDVEWSNVLLRIHSSSICARHGLIQFKGADSISLKPSSQKCIHQVIIHATHVKIHLQH